MMTNELVPSVSIENLLSQRDAIIERLRTAAKLFHEIETLAGNAFPQARYAYAVPALECRRLNSRFPDHLEDFEKSVDATAWDHLLAASGLRTFMDAEARKKWDDSISERKVPPLTDENIRATFHDLYVKRNEMFENGVIAVYKALSWDYKTNSPRRFGRRIILRYCVDTFGSGTKRWVTGPSYETSNKLDDLIRVLCILDGKPEPDSRMGSYKVLRETQWPKEQTVVELQGVLSIRGFKNGNGHITFLRSDLVDKMNLILAKHYSHTLPPAEEE
jgi:hypothetical protein